MRVFQPLPSASLATLRDPNESLENRLLALSRLEGRGRLNPHERESVRVHRLVLAGLVRTAGPTRAGGEVYFADAEGHLRSRLP